MTDTVSVQLDDQAYALDANENLLQGLLSRGAMVNHSCLAGVCRSCRLYDADTQAPLLSCQTQVSSPLCLISKPERQYDIEINQFTIQKIDVDWQWVDASVPFSLELGQPVLWQCGRRQGRAFQCAASHESVRFALPADIDLTQTRLMLADTRARFDLDLSATGIVVCDKSVLPVADVFQHSLAQRNMAASEQVFLFGAEHSYAALNFKRVDYAFILSNTAVNLATFEQWLQFNRVRVAQPIYLTFADQ